MSIAPPTYYCPECNAAFDKERDLRMHLYRGPHVLEPLQAVFETIPSAGASDGKEVAVPKPNPRRF